MLDIQLNNSLALDGIRILAIEQYGAGPWATLQLAELGAEVIKIEDPGSLGDVGRYVPPFQDGEHSLFFETFNGSKKSVSLDLRTEAGREVFALLVENSDAVFSNLRGDVPAKLGLRYADLASINPRIVCCALTGYGMEGPRAQTGALDYVIQGIAGWMSMTGEPTSPPTRMGLSLVDFAGGYVAAIALMAGLWQVKSGGDGCDCDISLHETALSLLTYVGTWAATHGYEPVRHPNSAHPSLVPFQNFETADGWIVIACPKEELWRRLCRAIDREDLLGDPLFVDAAARDRNREPLLFELSKTLRIRSTGEWLGVLAEAGVPAGPINNVCSALKDKQVDARNSIDTYTHEHLGVVRRIRSPLRLSGARRPPQRAPFRGEHTTELMDICSVDAATFDEFDRRGAFGETRGA